VLPVFPECCKDVSHLPQRQEGECLPLLPLPSLPDVGKVALPGHVFNFALTPVLPRLLLLMAGMPTQLKRASGRKNTCHDVLREHFTLETHNAFTAVLACQQLPAGLQNEAKAWVMEVFLLPKPRILGKIFRHVFHCIEVLIF